MTHKTKRERKYAAQFRADRVAELNRLQDAGGSDGAAARQQKAKMRDTWQKRQSNNVTGFAKPQGKRVKPDAGVVPARPALAALPGSKARKVIA